MRQARGLSWDARAGCADYILKPHDPDMLSKARQHGRPPRYRRRRGRHLASTAIPTLDVLAASLVQANARDAKAPRAVAERVEETAAQSGARQCASAIISQAGRLRPLRADASTPTDRDGRYGISASNGNGCPNAAVVIAGGGVTNPPAGGVAPCERA